jgi:MFS family permease
MASAHAAPRRLGEQALTLWTTGLLLASCLPQYLVGSLAIGMRGDFPFGEAELGLAAGVSFATAAVASPLAGRLSDRIGMRVALAVAALLTAASSLGIVMAGSAGTIVALMVLNGLGSGIGSPLFASLIASGVELDKQGIALGLLTSAPQMAAFGAGLALPLIAQPLDWRVGFVLPAVLAVACLWALMRSGAVPARATGGRASGPRIRGLRSIHLIGLAAALASAAVIGMRSFLVVFAVAEGFAIGAAGLLLSATGLIAIGSRLGFGMLGDRRPGDALRRAALLMALTATGFALMVAGSHALIVAGAILAGGVGWGWQSPLSLAVISRNRSATASAIGIQMTGFFVGALIGPLVIGLLAERGSYTVAWTLCGCLALAAGSVALLVRRLPPD